MRRNGFAGQISSTDNFDVMGIAGNQAKLLKPVRRSVILLLAGETRLETATTVGLSLTFGWKVTARSKKTQQRTLNNESISHSFYPDEEEK